MSDSVRVRHKKLVQLRDRMQAPLNGILDTCAVLLKDAEHMAQAEVAEELQVIQKAGCQLRAVMAAMFEQAALDTDRIDLAAFGSKPRHDIRSRLNSIIGFSALILYEIEAGGQAALHESVRNIQVSGRRLLSLVEDMEHTLDEDREAGA